MAIWEVWVLVANLTEVKKTILMAVSFPVETSHGFDHLLFGGDTIEEEIFEFDGAGPKHVALF